MSPAVVPPVGSEVTSPLCVLQEQRKSQGHPRALAGINLCWLQVIFSDWLVPNVSLFILLFKFFVILTSEEIC